MESQTNIEYLSPTATQTFQDQNATADYRNQTQQYYDGLGRASESRNYEDDTHFIAVDTTYDALGRVSGASNPYHPGDAMYWTTTGTTRWGGSRK